MAPCGLKVAGFFSRAIHATRRRVILAIFFLVVYTLPGLAQSRNAFTLNDISDLIKNGVRRIGSPSSWKNTESGSNWMTEPCGGLTKMERTKLSWPR